MPGALRDPLADLRTQFDRVIDELDGGEHAWRPRVDVVRNDGNLLLHADVPGIKPEEVKIEVADDVLTISGEHEESEEEKNRQYVRRERRYGSFSRSMALPSGVDAEKIEAETHDGVIHLTIPLPEKTETKTVSITPTAR